MIKSEDRHFAGPNEIIYLGNDHVRLLKPLEGQLTKNSVMNGSGSLSILTSGKPKLIT